jgi:alpha-L-fucosidase 2
MGWKTNVLARAQDGDHAHRMIRRQMKLVGGTYPNLFDAHPPFQIDGNFGATAGMAEMLLQSHTDCLHLLPALPAGWQSGSVRGRHARGEFKVSITWHHGHLTETEIVSSHKGRYRVRAPVPVTVEGHAFETIDEVRGKLSSFKDMISRVSCSLITSDKAYLPKTTHPIGTPGSGPENAHLELPSNFSTRFSHQPAFFPSHR